jgi:hypothetical protein
LSEELLKRFKKTNGLDFLEPKTGAKLVIELVRLFEKEMT